MKGLLASTAAACGVALLLAGAAFAKPPERFTDSFAYSGSVSCGAFDDVWEGSIEVSGMTTFDKAGNPVTEIVVGESAPGGTAGATTNPFTPQMFRGRRQ